MTNDGEKREAWLKRSLEPGSPSRPGCIIALIALILVLGLAVKSCFASKGVADQPDAIPIEQIANQAELEATAEQLDAAADNALDAAANAADAAAADEQAANLERLRSNQKIVEGNQKMLCDATGQC